MPPTGVGDHGGGEAWAYGIVNRYPVGIEAAVYYDPDDPDSTVLKPGAISARVYLVGGTGALFALVGLAALAIAGVRTRRA